MKNNYLLTYFKTGLMLFFLCFTAVSAVAQVIESQPMSHAVSAGKPTSFSITTPGNGSFNYFWQVSTNGGNSFIPLSNGGIYSGANTATLNISKSPVSMNGYQYKVVLTGASIGVAQSNAATLTVTVPSLVGNRDWKFVGAANVSEFGAQSTSIAIDQAGTPYIAYRRNEYQQYFAVVKKFNGTTWETLPTDGLTTDWVNQPVIATNSLGVPYLSYSNLLGYRGVAKKFNGADWETLGNASFSGGEAGFISFSFDNFDTPHAVYYDTQLNFNGTAKKFNGTSWVQVGSPIFSNGSAIYFSTAFDSFNTEYVAFRDAGNGGKARVIKFNGTNWQNVGTPEISAGLVHSTTVAIDAANTVYLSYKDEVNGNKIRVLKFNGTDWIPVGAAFVSDIVTEYSRLVLDPAGTPYVHAYTSDFKNLLFKFDGTDWQKIKTDNILSLSNGSLAFNPEGIPYIVYDDRTTGKARVVKYDIDIPVITSQPVNTIVTGGQFVNFNATVQGNSLSYQWQVSTDGGTTFTSIVNGPTYGNVTTARMYINNAPVSMNNYQYRLVANNGIEVISRAAVLNVESPEYNTAREWQLVGTQGFSSAPLNQAPSMTIGLLGMPIVGYADLNAGGKISVQKFENTTWETLGESTATSHTANLPSIKSDSFGKPYIAYQDVVLGGKASVVRHDGTSWKNIGDAGLSNGAITSITSAVGSNGVPFVAYADSSEGNKVTIKKFNGSSWENIGNPGFTNNEVKNISLAIDAWGVPSVAYQDADNEDKITVKKFDGTNWTNVGNSGFSDNKADNISLAIDAASIPYVVYQDSDSNNNPKINIKRFSGTTWQDAANTLPAAKIQQLSFVLDKSGTPFIGYNDYNDNLKTTVKRLINGNWENVGSSSFSEGATSFPTLMVSEFGIPFMAYSDATKENKLTVMQYNMVVTLSQENVSCFGDNNGSATVKVTGGQEPFYYEWSSNDSDDEDQSNEVSGLTKGTYTVTVIDNNGNQVKKSFVITEPDALKAVKTQTEVLCYGDTTGTATVSVTGGTGDYTYSWSPSGGTEATATELTPGTYEVTIKDTKDCTITENFTITQPTSPLVATAGPKTNVSCNGGNNGSASVSVTGGTGDYTYSWLPSGGTNATATGLTAGTYEVTVTDSNGCTNAVSDILISEPAALVATAGSQIDVSCNGGTNGSVTVNAAGGTFPYTYKWSENAGGATTQKISGLAGGTYSVEVTDNNNCTFTLANIIINEPAVLVATTGSQIDVSCNGGTNGSATVNITGGVFPYTYTWLPSGGHEATATGLSAGHYVVTVQDANLCTTTQDFTISQPLYALSTTTTQNNVSCNGGNNGSATVSVTGGVFPYTYTWLPSGSTGATATGLTAGIHTVTITDANLCTITQSVTITTITDVTVPVPDVTNLPNITNYCAVLAADIVIPTATDNCNGVIKATTKDPLSYTTEGNYTITWKYTDSNNNSTTQNQTINVIASPLKQIIFNNKEFSYDGNSHDTQIENLPAGATVTYSTSPATGSTNSATNSGIYTVTATITPASNMSNCTPQILTAEIKINKAAQKITFDALPTRSMGKDNSFQLEGKSNSGLPVSYTFNYTSTLAPANVSSTGMVTLLQSGEVTIVAHQDGNENYLSADSVSQVLVIKNGTASITQITIGNQNFENPQQQLNYLMDCGQSNPTITIQTENNSSLVFPANAFTIQTPKIGIYEQDVTVTSQDGTISNNYVIMVERRFNFFDIVQQKFNNVLLVNNNPQTNGGYEFVSYQWFKNGQLISTGQSYSAGDNITDTLDATAEYSVKMTTKDGLVLQTCSAAIQKLKSFQAKLYPNPIQAGQTITIDADYPVEELEKMHISIYSISGSLIQTVESSTAKTQMQLPPALQNGTYIVVLQTSNTKKSFKVIVNK